MGPELIALASGAAATLVTAMTTDAWKAVRAKLGRLLGRGDAKAEQAALATLDEDAAALATDAGPADELRAQWTVRLRDLLRVEPGAAVLLRELVAELPAPGAGVSAGRDVRADRGSVIAGKIDGGVHIGNPPKPGTGGA